MKILLDTCVWAGVAQELRAAGHEVVCPRRKIQALKVDFLVEIISGFAPDLFVEIKPTHFLIGLLSGCEKSRRANYLRVRFMLGDYHIWIASGSYPPGKKETT